jgi:hypothetical protein
MKHRISLKLIATGVVAMLAFSNCKKSLTATDESSFANQAFAGTEAAQLTDRIDAIVKDLSKDRYSFSFEKPIQNGGITRTAYGADNYFTFADPQDLICPDPIRIRYKKVPIWRRPTWIWPTCPDMIIDLSKISRIQEVLAKADFAQFGSLKGIKTSNGGVLLASEKFTRNYSNIQLDRMDAITRDLDHARFVVLGSPDIAMGGALSRTFYGYADLNSIVFRPYQTNLRDLIRPTLKGCFDPLILRTIRERLMQFNAQAYRGLEVKQFGQRNSIAVLQ